VDVKQAAEALGISSEGIRQRIRRGSLRSEKDTDGRVYVFIDEEATNGTPYEPSTDDVVSRLENEVEFLRKELATRDAEIQRRDAVLLSLSEGLIGVEPSTGFTRGSRFVCDSFGGALQYPLLTPQTRDAGIGGATQAQLVAGVLRVGVRQ
jgi:hypothetical protein